MSFCPKCKCEYREGFSECADCEEILVDSLPKSEFPKEQYSEVYLKTVSTDIDAEMLIEMLSHEGIPVRKKYRECGDYLKVFMGNTIMGIDLFVPSELYERAYALSTFEAETNSDEELLYCDSGEICNSTTENTLNSTDDKLCHSDNKCSDDDLYEQDNKCSDDELHDTDYCLCPKPSGFINKTTDKTMINSIGNTIESNTGSTIDNTIDNNLDNTVDNTLDTDKPQVDTSLFVDSYIKRQRTVQLILLIVFISPIIIGLIVSLYYLVKHLF